MSSQDSPSITKRALGTATGSLAWFPDLVPRVLTPLSQQLGSERPCVCPAIDHEFCHNIVKVAVDPRDDSRFLQ